MNVTTCNITYIDDILTYFVAEFVTIKVTISFDYWSHEQYTSYYYIDLSLIVLFAISQLY